MKSCLVGVCSDADSALFVKLLGGGGRFMAPHYRSSTPSLLAWVLGHFSHAPVLLGASDVVAGSLSCRLWF